MSFGFSCLSLALFRATISYSTAVPRFQDVLRDLKYRQPPRNHRLLNCFAGAHLSCMCHPNETFFWYSQHNLHGPWGRERTTVSERMFNLGGKIAHETLAWAGWT